MRLWSLHPKYLDSKGLVALWREALLAKKVLRRETSGYRAHPQLIRFRDAAHPLGQLNSYLAFVYQEACIRGFSFNASKIGPRFKVREIVTTSGQLQYELNHLKKKLKMRSPENLILLPKKNAPEQNPAFKLGPGKIEGWEKISV